MMVRQLSNSFLQEWNCSLAVVLHHEDMPKASFDGHECPWATCSQLHGIAMQLELTQVCAYLHSSSMGSPATLRIDKDGNGLLEVGACRRPSVLVGGDHAQHRPRSSMARLGCCQALSHCSSLVPSLREGQLAGLNEFALSLLQGSCIWASIALHTAAVAVGLLHL